MNRIGNALRSLWDRLPPRAEAQRADATPARHPNLLIKKARFGVTTRQRAADLPRVNAERLAEVAAAAAAEQAQRPVLPPLAFMQAPPDPIAEWQHKARRQLGFRAVNLDRMTRNGYVAGANASKAAVAELLIAVDTPDAPVMQALRSGAPLDMLIGSLREEAERLQRESGIRPIEAAEPADGDDPWP